MLLSLTVAFLQVSANPPQPVDPPLPERTYQPRVFDPGLDGGKSRSFSRGEFTPDGRLLIAFRRFPDPDYATKYRTALTVALTDPDDIVESATGHLDRFYDPAPANGLYGSDFAFGAYESTVAPTEYTRIHWSYELIPCDGTGHCITACPPNGMSNDAMLDPDYPTPGVNGSAMMTVAFRPLLQGNPYTSDVNGIYVAGGTYTTYELWVVRTHYPEFLLHECNPAPNGSLVRPTENNSKAIFTSQNVTVIIDETNQAIVSAVAEPDQLLQTSGLADIRGIEPSITADGRLIVYHGAGANPVAFPGNAVVTYVFNLDPCDPNGWTPPRSITELPSLDDLKVGTVQVLDHEQFKQLYRIFAQPIRMPNSGISGLQVDETYASGDDIIGTYPWVSKDGSFWNAYSVRGTDVIDNDGCPSERTKCAAYVCGDLTNWTIKHIDDPGINPTRHGGLWSWPVYAGNDEESWGAISMSTGATPGLWEFLFGEDAPIPGITAGSRIPVMPLIVPIIDTYGEMRFEEADGNYLLYLACNESLAERGSLPDPAETVPPCDPNNLLDSPAFLIDPTTTPDSAGAADTALCTLNAGAAFPQEVYLSAPGVVDYHDASEALRDAIGDELLDSQGFFHENVGFKGQGIVMNGDGAIDVVGAERVGGLEAFTVQMFVKSVGASLADPGQTTTLFEYGLRFGGENPVVKLEVDDTATFRAEVVTQALPTVETISVATRDAAIDANWPLTDPTDGWRHVTVSYIANATLGRTYLRIYLDGLLEDTAVHDGYLPLIDFPGLLHYYYVGPGRTVSPSTVTLSNMSLVFDEVAVSNVKRTRDEIRRDAYVEPLPDAFGPWPAGAPDPAPLDPEQGKWPVGTLYDPTIAVLGRQLFLSNTLSASDTDPAVSGNRSCAFCHDLGNEFTDSPLQFPLDVDDLPLPPFNTPTLQNAGFGGHKTFSGKAASLEAQVVFPLTSGSEMGVQTMQDVVTRVQADPSFDFPSAFNGEQANEENLADALAMYVRTLNTGWTPFDQGPTSLSLVEQLGQVLFFGKARCFHCHRGTSFSDDLFHNIRTVDDTSIVDGHGGFTGRANEIGAVKTPTLRNVEPTEPYFHDGSAATLTDVIDHYDDPFGTEPNAKGPTDRSLRRLGLTPLEKTALEAFLKALSDH